MASSVPFNRIAAADLIWELCETVVDPTGSIAKPGIAAEGRAPRDRGSAQGWSRHEVRTAGEVQWRNP